jgi:hypothetical protein
MLRHLLGKTTHMPQARLFSEEEEQYYFPKPTMNSKARGEKEYVKQSIW